jgi:hypothetical protein
LLNPVNLTNSDKKKEKDEYNNEIEVYDETKKKQLIEKKIKIPFYTLHSSIKTFLMSNDETEIEKSIREFGNFSNNKEIMNQIFIVIQHYFTDIQIRRFQFSIYGEDMSFNNIIEIKQKYPRVEILSYARRKITNIDECKIFEKLYLKYPESGLLKIGASPKDSMKYLKYKYYLMKSIKGELGENELINLSQNINLNNKILQKYFKNIEFIKDEHTHKDTIDPVLYKYYLNNGYLNINYNNIKQNLRNNKAVPDNF